ncbi:hypothetical protein A1OO_20245 [Enterovibrio norvegicus FF-33]|uniref:hypothetical protein n=1 Tax=Enterovibrio norvegicus TaxID=188144 RepID=UPI000316B755|nr:hypothetical protein [Enterovibrio norvegicus]OEE68063.1 hypothetical protein A1OO_20245 [Enterovibrio norvegicus FF-33]
MASPSYTDEYLELVGQSLAGDIEYFSSTKPPARNMNQKMWTVWWLRNNVTTWAPEMVETLLNNVSVASSWDNVMDEIFPYNGISAPSKKFFRSSLLSLVTNCARKKVAPIPAHLRWDTDVVEEIHGSSPLSLCYPRLALEVLAESSKIRQEKYKGIITPKLTGFDIKPKSLSANANQIARYMLCRGIESFNEMTVESFVSFRIEQLIDRPTTDIPWKILCEIYERQGLLPSGWVEKVIEEYSFSQPAALMKAAERNGSEEIKRSGYISNVFGEFKLDSGSTKKQVLSSIYSKGVVRVYVPEGRENIVSFGEFMINRKLDHFAHQHLSDENAWKKVELSWTSITDIERSTEKVRSNMLLYLNAYLFEYLPWFFEKHPNVLFEYPDTPSKFLGSVFVKTDPVLDSEYKKQAKVLGKEVIYPVSLLSFADGLINSSRMKVTKKNIGNGLRDACSGLRRFFDFIQARYSDIDGFAIKSNPIIPLKNVGYRRSGKTVKETFNLGYWIAFRIFIKEVAKGLMFAASKEVIKALAPHEGKKLLEYNRELTKIKGFEHLDLVTYSSNFDRITIPSAIKIGSKMLDIGEIFSPEFRYMRTKTNNIGQSARKVTLPNYQSLLVLNVSAYAGQRSSNGAHLCADTFDQDYIRTAAENPVDVLVPLRIRTDKIKANGLESTIQEDVMIMLRHAKEIRKHYSHKAFTDPRAYQNNDLSVHGHFRPLLQSTTGHSDIHPNMGAYVFMYEKWLKKHGIEFDSKLVLTPNNLTVEQYETVREHGLEEIAKVMLIEYEDLDEPIPFTPLTPKTPLTPHSLRAQLATFIKITTGDNEAVRMFTGQTDGTIGYYTKATPEDEANLSRIARKIKNSSDVVPVLKMSITEGVLTQMFDEINWTNNDIPFFAESEMALKVFRDSGGRGLAINHTHICPYDNKCPEEVVNLHGYMNCHECSHACITSHNRFAIAAAARRALDEMQEYSGMILVSSNESEKQQLNVKYLEQVHIASCWIARHNHIRNNPDKFVIAGFDALKQYSYVPASKVSNELLAKMTEVSGVPSLQSNALKKVAAMIAHKINNNVSQKTMPALSAETQFILRYDPVSYVVNNLSMLAQLHNTTPECLIEQTTMSNQDVSFIEVLKLV